MTFKDRVFKRSFDISLSSLGLFFALPMIVTAWCISAVETRSNGFYTQSRIGLGGCMFKVIKIKTMKNTSGPRSSITSESASEITRSGYFFRKYKVDELPQLWNVLLGDMSFVGPRPDVPGYADEVEGENKLLLSIRPGITGPASLKYKNEEMILKKKTDPKKYNDEVIWPDKVKINVDYVKNYSFMSDLRYIIRTVVG
ncbi:MAG: sugar transferase [Cocleimonas sp.]